MTAQPTRFQCEAAIIDEDTHEGQYAPTSLMAYLCPHCSNTHLEILVDGAMRVLFTLPPIAAEKIAGELINPVPLSPDQMSEATAIG